MHNRHRNGSTSVSHRRAGRMAMGAGVVAVGAVALIVACNADLSPFFVSGPPVNPNVQPSLDVTSPTSDISVARGNRLLITWTDSDPDSAAVVSFDLINTTTGEVFDIVDGIEENNETDSWSADTLAIPEGSYNLRGQITDFVTTVDAFAEASTTGGGRVVVTVAGEGSAPANVPPRIDISAPLFNQGVSQDDVLIVEIRPIDFDPNLADPDQGNPGEIPYDPDSDTTVLIMLDVDSDSTNDDPFNPDPNELIILAEQAIPEDEFGTIQFNITIDLATVPIRPDGIPYFVRATISDSTNPPLSVYADGTINVVQAVEGPVLDMQTLGKTSSGAKFVGFNPGSNVGSTITSIGDFDDDGVEDFVILAQFGNPRNRGKVGEGYLIYGQPGNRFGGQINVNSTSTSVDGVIFDAGPLRCLPNSNFSSVNCPGVVNLMSYGLTSVSPVGDLDGDGRPELVFGLPHIDGIFQGRDDDQGDDPPSSDETETVTVTVREGQVTRQVNDGGVVTESYSGSEDTYISSAEASANFGSSTELEWVDDGGNASFILLKFTDVLAEIPDSPIAITNLQASLRVRAVDTGDAANLHQLFTDFNESDVTYNNFSGGGGPVADEDYGEEELGTIDGGTAGDFTEVDITPLVQQLIDDQLDDIDNELRMIIVPNADDGADNVRIRSSEFGSVPDHRPRLSITYDRLTFGTGLGCYLDPFVNNAADTTPGDDNTFEALGVAVIFNSSNRDAAGLVNPDRLNSTTVELEHVGQQADNRPADIIVEAVGTEDGRTAGARIQAGWYDLVDHLLLNQPPYNGRFGWTVASIPDMDNDQLPEILISAPTNELDIQNTEENFGVFSTHNGSRPFDGSVTFLPGSDYDNDFWRDKTGSEIGNASLPAPLVPEKQYGQCSGETIRRFRASPTIPSTSFQIYAEDVNDFMGGARSAGDFTLDGVPDILVGAPGNDTSGETDAGAVYILYGRVPTGDYDLRDGAANIDATRPPMLRIFGETANDQLGGELIRGDVREPRKAGFFRQVSGEDVNGDRIRDVIIGGPRIDFGDVDNDSCSGDFDGNGIIDGDDLDLDVFLDCVDDFGSEVFTDDACKVFDYDNDREITNDATRNYTSDGQILNDRDVLECLIAGDDGCCPVDNGFVGVVFGGTTTNGDRFISQIGTSDLPGVRFHGASAGDRAGMDIGSAGDFNQDGFGDILIAAPGVERLDDFGQSRLGVVYLIYGGTHLINREFNLAEVGTTELPGIVFLTPYVMGRPNEAPPDHVGLLGDINNDGFDDIAIGITSADFIDESLPQDPGGPVSGPEAGRIVDTGDAFIIYGNNFGSNSLQ